MIKNTICDKAYAPLSGDYRFEGRLDEAIRHIIAHQIKPAPWKAFVQQYRTMPDGENLGWRGEFWGKLMRGACLVYEYTRDEDLYTLLTETVEDMLTTQQDSGRFSTYSVDKEFYGWDMWCRKYVMLGMEYYGDICRMKN